MVIRKFGGFHTVGRSNGCFLDKVVEEVEVFRFPDLKEVDVDSVALY